jgi:aldehyde dehydrogenase (NAD+)
VGASPVSDGATFTSIDPSTEQPLAQIARATPADIDKAVRAARRAQRRSWGTLPGKERAKYLFRIARILQERSREFAVLESMDSGKPIKESRDVDVPLGRGPLLVLRGLGRQARVRIPRPRREAARRRCPDHPVELPAAHAFRGRSLRRWPPATRSSSSPRRRPPQRAAVRRRLPPGRPAAGRGQHHAGARRDRDGAGDAPGVDKVAFTGSTEIGKKIQRGVAGTDKALTLELGGKAANIVFDDAPLDQAVEGIVNGIYFNQGEVCCAGSRLLVQESIADALIDKLKDRLATIRVGDPLDKNTDVGAINSKSQLEKITELVQAGVDEGADLYQPPVRPAGAWLFLPADPVHERRPEPPHRARGDLRAGPLHADVPDAGRGRREGQQHRLRAVGRASGPRRGAGSWRWSRRCVPASCGRTRSIASIRRRRSAATSNRVSGARAACTGSRVRRLEDR